MCCSLRCVSSSLSTFSFTEVCSGGKRDLQVCDAAEGFSDIIKIYGFLKAFQTKVFLCGVLDLE